MYFAFVCKFAVLSLYALSECSVPLGQEESIKSTEPGITWSLSYHEATKTKLLQEEQESITTE